MPHLHNITVASIRYCGQATQTTTEEGAVGQQGLPLIEQHKQKKHGQDNKDDDSIFLVTLYPILIQSEQVHRDLLLMMKKIYRSFALDSASRCPGLMP